MRVLVRRLHLIVSLIAGLWLAISGLAGSLLVWGDALDRAVHPELFRVARPAATAPLSVVLENAGRAGGAAVIRMRLAGSGTPVHEVWVGCDRCVRVWVDPSTAEVNGVRSARGTARGFLHELHRRMLGGERREKLVGVGGMALAALAVSGIVLWWPRRGWRRAVRIERSKGWKLLNYDLHRVLGFFVSPLLLVAALTGIYFIHHEPFDRFVAWLHDGRTQSGVETQAAASVADPIERAKSLFPGSIATWFMPPAQTGDPMVVRLRQRGEAHPNGRTFVSIDSSGAIAGVTDALSAPAGRRLLDHLYPLHIGRLGGTAHRIVLSVAGLAPLVLMVSGLLAWWNRSLRRTVGGKVIRRFPELAPALPSATEAREESPAVVTRSVSRCSPPRDPACARRSSQP